MIPLDLAHAPVLAEMHRLCFDDPWGEADLARTLAMPGVFGFMAGAADAPQGFVLGRLVADEAEILILLVLPAYRRARIGRALLDAAIGRAGAASMMFLEVSADNVAGQALYESAGFYTVGLRPRYYGTSDALILRKDLDGPGGGEVRA